MHTTISVAGQSRSFTVVGDPDGPENRPLVLVFHGSKQDGERHRTFTGKALDELTDQGQAVVVYLDGHRGNWNDARRESYFPARKDGVDDVAFARAVVDVIAVSHRVDHNRVLGVGYSNGGQMVFRLLHEAGELLAGAIVVAATMPDREGFLGTLSENAVRPVPITLVAGTADRIVPFNGGRMSWWVRTIFKVGGVTMSAADTANYFAHRNGITATPSVTLLPERTDRRSKTRTEQTVYQGDGRPSVTLYSVHGGGHTIPGSTPAPALLGKTGTGRGISEMVADVIDATRSAQ